MNDSTIGQLDAELKRIEPAVRAASQTEIGYVQMTHAGGEERLYEIFLTRCVDSEKQVARGTLLFGVPFKREHRPGETIYSLWVEGKMQMDGLPDGIQEAVRSQVAVITNSQGRASLTIGKVPYSFFYRAMNPESRFPPAYQISLQPLGALQEEKRDLRKQIAIAGMLALTAGLGISLALAAGWTAPINALVRGTHEVEKGQFDVKIPVRSQDEIGRLTQSFNEMAAGLMLREKYRSVLDMVADKNIADDLINGQIELGGEERDVSVLFCDIRGFTALSERMEPKEVIEMLNEHFTPLTRLVYEHHGAVDKFVGDLIMAIFGAPKGFWKRCGKRGAMRRADGGRTEATESIGAVSD